MATVSLGGTEFQNKSNSLSQEARVPVETMERGIERISHQAGEKMGAMAADIATVSKQYVESGKGYVKEHPVRSVAYAAAAGVVAGSLVTMLVSRRH